MTRRPKESIKDFAEKINALSLDELNELRIELGREHNNHVLSANLVRRKLDTVKNVMFIRKNGGEIGITDHAVLRYMERHKGIDVRAIRHELSALATARKSISGTDGHFDSGGVRLVIPQGNVMATVLPKAESSPDA